MIWSQPLRVTQQKKGTILKRSLIFLYLSVLYCGISQEIDASQELIISQDQL